MATTKNKTTSKVTKAKTTSTKAAKVSVGVGKYFYAVGRRKSAIATVRLFEGSEVSTINGNSISLGEKKLSQSDNYKIMEPLRLVSKDASMYFTAKVSGGGTNAQLEAIVLGISRALVKYDESLKKLLKSNGLMTRDSRIVERKKVGLRKARKSPQFSKR